MVYLDSVKEYIYLIKLILSNIINQLGIKLKFEVLLRSASRPPSKKHMKTINSLTSTFNGLFQH